MAKRPPKPPPPGKKYVFRPWREDPRTGRILYAAQFGFKAWPILADE
jgi:hypothetical protein